MVSTKKGAREMNSKQIADELENIYWIQGDGKGKPFQQYADFVRQQQAEIEALNRFIEERGETGQFIIWKTKQ